MLTPMPENAIPLYIVTSGDDPRLEEYRLSHETELSYVIYQTYGDDLTRQSGTTSRHKFRLKGWGYAVFFDHKAALQCQRKRLVDALDKHQWAADQTRSRLEAHVETWGQL